MDRLKWPRPWSSLVEGDEQKSNKYIWHAAMHVLHIVCGVCHKHNSLPLGPIQPLSNKKLHASLHVGT